MRRLLIVLAIAAVLALTGFATFKWAARNPQDLALRQLGEVAAEAYVFGYPLVLMDETRRAMLAVPDIETNWLHHQRERPQFGDEVVVRPNRDTLYSLAWLDLSNGPALLSYPDAGQRYWMAQVLDAWSDVEGSVGSSRLAPGAVGVQIAGPGWDGPVLEDYPRIEVSTDTAWLLIRIAVSDTPEDLEAARALQDEFWLTAHESEQPDFQRSRERPSDAVASLPATAFFLRMSLLLNTHPPRPADLAMTDRLEALGLVSGQYDETEFGPLARWAMARGVDVARDRLVQGVRSRPYGPTNWRTALNLGEYGTNYALRAGVALVGLGANLPQDALYPSTDIDSQGRALSGDHVYELRFAPGQSPPTSAFWSVTAYDSDGFLQDVDRHTLGDRDRLAREIDGTLVLRISADPPDDAPASNWLPVAPGAPFQLTARLYDPAPEALSGAWRMPPVERLD